MRISLADEIREISQVAPKDFDPDDLHLDQEEQCEGQAAATEHYLLEIGYACCLQSIFSSFTILALPLSARPRIACRIRNTSESVCRERS
jgi:hypothetical protein